MYKNILIPLDLAKENEQVIQLASQLGTPKKTSIRLLHVVEKLSNLNEDNEIREFYQKLGQNAENFLQDWIQKLSKKGFEAKAEVIFGKRAEGVVQYAAQQNIDLILMRSHKIDTNSPNEHFGTLSHQVALFSQCSVLLARE